MNVEAEKGQFFHTSVEGEVGQLGNSCRRPRLLHFYEGLKATLKSALHQIRWFKVLFIFPQVESVACEASHTDIVEILRW